MAAETRAAALAEMPAGPTVAKMKPLTGWQLRGAGLSMRDKAGGAAGLQTADWRHWPMQHWNMLAVVVAFASGKGGGHSSCFKHTLLYSPRGASPLRGCKRGPSRCCRWFTGLGAKPGPSNYEVDSRPQLICSPAIGRKQSSRWPSWLPLSAWAVPRARVQEP